jgi:hypothetical protein
MELYIWFWKRRVHGRDFAKKVGICEQTVSNLAGRLQSSSLLTAIKIHEVTDGAVGYEDLLDESSLNALAEWRADNAEKASLSLASGRTESSQDRRSCFNDQNHRQGFLTQRRPI